jgi:alanine racemase
MPRPIFAEIHPNAVRHNLELAKRKAAGARIWGVVKADAYGHGIERIYPGLEAADGIGLLDLNEAVRVRELGWTKPILLLEGIFTAEDVQVADRYRLTMTLRSELIGIQTLSEGETVGYGRTFTAPHAMRIGVVACGYADGYPRHAPTGTPVAVDGVETRLVGRISMDMLTVDLTPVPAARVGSRVELWGGQIRIDDVASSAGTIGYELMCALARRVPVGIV